MTTILAPAAVRWQHVELLGGVVLVHGADRHDLLHRICTQDCRQLKDTGRCARALFCTHQGRLIDWVELIELGDALAVLTSLGRAQRLIDWLEPFTIMEDVTYTLVGEAIPSVLLLPQAPDDADAGALADLGQSLGLGQLPATGEAHRLGSSVTDDGVLVLHAHPALGRGLRLVPITGEVPQALRKGTLASAVQLELRRLMAGLPSPEFEFAQQAAPFELRLMADNVHWHKGCYIGQEVLSRLEAYDKVARLLMGVEATQGAALLQQEGLGAAKVFVDGRAQGRLTSALAQRLAAPADATDGFVGLALLKREAAVPGAAQLRFAAKQGEAALPPVPITLCARPLWSPR